MTPSSFLKKIYSRILCLFFHTKILFLWVNVILNNSSFFQPACCCYSPTLALFVGSPSHPIPGTAAHSFSILQFLQSLIFHPLPHLLQNKEAELGSPPAAGRFCWRRGGNKTVPSKALLWRTKHCKKHNRSGTSEAAPGLEDGHERSSDTSSCSGFYCRKF